MQKLIPRQTTDMKSGVFFTTALLTLMLSAMSAQAARFSWIDDPLSDHAAWGGLETQLDPNVSAFGVDAYDSRNDVGLPGDAFSPRGGFGEEPLGSNVIRLYGGLSTPRAVGVYSAPVFGQESALQPTADGRLNAIGAKWQHRLDATHSFAVSAGYRETVSLYQSAQDVLDTRAAISWSSRWAGGLRPGVTGSLFVGDETARDAVDRLSGRKYYGFTIGGELTLFQEHTPYLSYRLQRSLYDTAEDPLAIQSRYDDRSQILAGWKWQVQRNWSLQAEASYSFNTTATTGLDPYNPERSRIFFGTRFDFR
jgi:hypothetical protein